MKLPGRSVIKKQVGIGSGQLKNDDKKKMIESSLVAQFKTPTTVESNLLGAARGLLVNEPGLASLASWALVATRACMMATT